MDYRKNMNTPRDMIEDELLLRLLREKEPSAAAQVFGGNVRREPRRRSSAGTGNCGCRQTREREYPRERPQEYRHGCGEETASEPERCGCQEHQEHHEHPADYDRRDRDNSPCEPCANDDRMKHFALAMAYVPIQEWEMLYDEETALIRGTLFEALDLPWYQSACGDQRGRESSCGKCGGNR